MRELGLCRAQIQAIIEDARLSSFYSVLGRIIDLTDGFVSRRMVERLRDTTNTFHLPFGEMTITSFDFFTLMGPDFTWEPLVY